MGLHTGQNLSHPKGNEADGLHKSSSQQALLESVILHGPGPHTRGIPRYPGGSNHQIRGRNITRQAGRHSDQTSTCNPNRKPHQAMLLSHTISTTTPTSLPTIPSNSRKQEETGGIFAGPLFCNCLQHMRTLATAHDVRPTSHTINRPHSDTQTLPQPHPSANTLAGGSQGKSGVGFWLTQKHCNCQGANPFCCREGWRVTLVGSRFTHSAESRYAPVEGEALAVAEALDRARHFVLGCSDLIVAVDHKHC